MANLYELMDDYRALLTALETEELTDKQIQAVLDAVDEKKGSLREKVDNVCRLLANLEGDAEKFKIEEARLARRRKALENKAKRLRNWVRSSMDILEVPEIKTTVHNVRLGVASQVVVIVDDKLVPDEYVKVERKPKKAEILKAYKEDGEIVPGTKVEEGQRTLTIR